MEKAKIGLIGLGEMGKPMAKNLLKNGFVLTVCGHVRKGPVEELRALGAMVANSPKAVAEASQVIISVVRDTRQTDEVVLGEGFWEGRGIWHGMKPGSVIILCSTLEPAHCQKLAAAGRKRGVAVLDAALSGGLAKAESGTLTFMVGGDKETFDNFRPVFEAMGRNIFHLGGPGTGQVLKLVNQYMAAVTRYGTSEAIAIGLKAGLDLKRMLEALRVSTGNSSMVERYEWFAARKKESEKQPTGAVPLIEKDMSLAIKLAEEVGARTDLGRFVLQMDASRLFPTEPL